MAHERVAGVREQSDPSAVPAAEHDSPRHGADRAAGAPETPDALVDTASAPDELIVEELDELAATAAQRDEYLALAQRTQADFENYRKRVARDAAAAAGPRAGRGSRASCCRRSTTSTARSRTPATPTPTRC